MFDLIYRFDPEHAVTNKLPTSAEEACRVLMQGNHEFVQLTDAPWRERRTSIIPIDSRAFGWGVNQGSAPAQEPFAAVLGCADARVPTEMVFTKGCNELFVVRVAGNVLGQECLGSLRFAMNHFSSTLKLLLVLGHTQCGAVTEAVNVYLEPKRYMEMATDPSTRAIEDHIAVAVRVAAMTMEKIYGADLPGSSGYHSALLQASVVLNAAWSAYCLRQEFGQQHSRVGIVFGVYDLVTRSIGLRLSATDRGSDEPAGLFAPPADAEQFRKLAYEICGSALVRSLLRRECEVA